MNAWTAIAAAVAAAACGYLVGRRQTHRARGELRECTESLQSFAAGVQVAAERERAAIARDLHDQLGGIFVASRMDIDVIGRQLPSGDAALKAKLVQVAAALDSGLALKRSLVERLHPSILDHLGLYAALQWRLSELCNAAKRECAARVPDGDPGFAGDAAIAVYRIAESAMARALAAADVGLLELDASDDDGELRLAITDDARLTSAPGIAGAGWLAPLDGRAHSLGGSCRAESAASGGTRVTIRVPLARMR